MELHLSAPSKHQSDAIHRSLNNKLEWIESEWLAEAVTEQKEDFKSVDSSSAPGTGLAQPSTASQNPTKRSREAVPLELVPVKEPRITQFNLATQSVPADRLPHQRQVKGTSFFGDLIQSNSVQQLATSRLVGLSQSRPRSSSSGLATSTRPGRSGEDKRPGMTSGPQRKDFIVVPVPPKSSLVRPPTQQQSPPLTTSVLPNDRVVPSSLFLTDDDTPIDPPTTFPIDSDPDLPDSIVDDSLGITDDSIYYRCCLSVIYAATRIILISSMLISNLFFYHSYLRVNDLLTVYPLVFGCEWKPIDTIIEDKMLNVCDPAVRTNRFLPSGIVACYLS